MESLTQSSPHAHMQLHSAIPYSSTGSCRLCNTPLRRSVVDLGLSPLANSFIKPELQNAMEAFYPLHAFICEKCFLVQLSEFESPSPFLAITYIFHPIPPVGSSMRKHMFPDRSSVLRWMKTPLSWRSQAMTDTCCNMCRRPGSGAWG